ncbi:hypothetical protein GGQ54_000023 [Naumannella cuiyingiana]|uniref:Uncharacterized protein n=1 Tax=Naumannella cuiyingiana TaxID=1347891 RepID=A0A7Z0D605_9ACTN|nr:hypothetical protein [Naumannella cuiyingiana]NYI69463.1 hypothetical protein [Naumannella cuiyingiana]
MRQFIGTRPEDGRAVLLPHHLATRIGSRPPMGVRVVAHLAEPLAPCAGRFFDPRVPGRREGAAR